MILRKAVIIEIITAVIVAAGLALLIFLGLRPGERYEEVLERQRQEQVEGLMAAFYRCVFERGGIFPELETGVYYLIGQGEDFSGCQQQELTGVFDLAGIDCGGGRTLVPDYLSAMLVAPAARPRAKPLNHQLAERGRSRGGEWDINRTGFYIRKLKDNKILLGACDSDTKIIQ